MKKFLLCLLLGAFLLSCNGDKDKTATTDADKPAATPADKPAVDLPYTAAYSSSWSNDVSDADLKMVLTSYKDWADANFDGISKALGDSVSWDMTTGAHFDLPNAGIIKMWKTYRDSLSSVRVEMEGWNKMYATDKKQGFVVTWYKEYDTYKTGKVDSAAYHDINLVKDGKIVWLSQYKRPLK
jgi:hypothetical protein